MSRFLALAALGAYAWADDRDQRFTAKPTGHHHSD
jgi:hypothetical protein